MFEPGIYKGKLVDAGVSQLNNEKQTPYIYLTFTLTHYGNGAELQEPVNREVRMFLSEKALSYTEDNLKKLGFNGNYEAPEFRNGLYLEGCELGCEHSQNDGKTYENWGICGLGGSGEKKPLPKATLKTLNAKWKAHQGGFKESPTITPPPAKTPARVEAEAAVAADDDDSIPF